MENVFSPKNTPTFGDKWAGKLDYQVFVSGKNFFDSFENSIQKAKFEILIEVYIFAMDPLGIRILEKLADATSRGVKVRILVDGIGSFYSTRPLRDFCHKHQIHFSVFHPIPLSARVARRWSWTRISRTLGLFARINNRNHRKMFLIDRELIFVGSMNITDAHSEEFHPKNFWRDTSIKIKSVNTDLLVKAFDRAWRNFFRLRRHKNWPSSDFFRLNVNRQLRKHFQQDLLRRLRSAKSRILVTNAYFLPQPSIVRALIHAAQRGVYVGLILPGPSDIPLVKWAARSLYIQLLQSGVLIYEYQPRVLHAKTLIIDNYASLGSHNWNHRSFIHDLELELSIPEADFCKTLEQHWDEDIRSSRPLTLRDCGRTNIFYRALYKLAYWIRYWL